jgi:hypothetical protein
MDRRECVGVVPDRWKHDDISDRVAGDEHPFPDHGVRRLRAVERSQRSSAVVDLVVDGGWER